MVSLENGFRDNRSSRSQQTKKASGKYIIIGIDHGFGNIKTANHCFPMSVKAYDTEPLFTKNILTYQKKHYLIGEGHKSYQPNKVLDEDYYIATLAAIAEELSDERLTTARVLIAAGLPLTWTTIQKREFRDYLTRNKEVTFYYRNNLFEMLF